MKCPNCGQEMKEVQTPQISAKEVMEVGKDFPVKLECYLIRIYGCETCPVRATFSETKAYIPEPALIIDGLTCIYSGACKKEHKTRPVNPDAVPGTPQANQGYTTICPCADYKAKK